MGVLAESFREACSFIKLATQDTSLVLRELADGNFTVKSKHRDKYIGAFQDILTSMKQLKRQMNMALKSISEASGQVSAGAGQMAESA